MKTLKYIMICIIFINNTIHAQNNINSLDGSKPFVLTLKFVEMCEYEDDHSKIYEMDTKVSFTPSSKNSGLLSIWVEGETEKVKIKINNIRGIIKDGKTFYMGNSIDDINKVYVWSFGYFFYSNGKDIIQITDTEN